MVEGRAAAVFNIVSVEDATPVATPFKKSLPEGTIIDGAKPGVGAADDGVDAAELPAVAAPEERGAMPDFGAPRDISAPEEATGDAADSASEEGRTPECNWEREVLVTAVEGAPVVEEEAALPVPPEVGVATGVVSPLSSEVARLKRRTNRF